MHVRTRRIAITLLAVGSLAVAACGDDDGDDTDPDTTDEPQDTGEDSTDTTVATDDTGDSSDIDTSPDDGVQLLASGSADTIELPVAYEVGKTASSVIHMDLNIDAEAVGEVGATVEIGLTQTVAEASPEKTTIEMAIDSVDVLDAPPGLEDQMEDQFDELIGETLVLRYDANGKKVGETELKSGRELSDDLVSSFDSSTQVVVPTEPVGVGAEWTAVVPTESNGVQMDVETTYELTELTADGYVITLSQNTPIDTEFEGSSATGTIVGSGEIRGSRTNALLQELTYDQDAEMSISGSGDMTMNIAIEMTSE
jgi:hypothetical protein